MKQLLKLSSLLILLVCAFMSCDGKQEKLLVADETEIPAEDRFKREFLDFNLNEPMELDELPGKGIVYIERSGILNFYDFKTNKAKVLAEFDLYFGSEDGLQGMAVDPNYEKNNWIYFFYSAPGDEAIERVSRFELIGEKLDFDSEKILLEIPTIRNCCHHGGSLEFGPNGNLFIGIGDSTNPFESSGYAPIDEREGRALWDAQKSSGNTNDLRGKILRIKPEDDGTYSIPDGNLFPVGTPKTRPEIYTMGLRNPFRFSIDSKTGYLYWGDVGPDAGKIDSLRGPAGLGEFNQARKAGNWGWPYTRGNNKVYHDYDFDSKKSGDEFDAEHIINDSPNNTGLEKLPPVQKSLIWYPYKESKEFPWLGKGGVNPMAGPVFHSADYSNAKETFPPYFEDKFILYEWMRNWIYVVTLDENGDYVKAKEFMPNSKFAKPMDMIFASDGNLYVLEYGTKWRSQNIDARLNRISYLKGNRTPIAKIETDKIVGAHPLKVQFSGEESLDYDKDKLTYEWSFIGSDIQSTEKNPSFTFNKAGTYTVSLKVADTEGLSSSTTTKILVGNDPPKIVFELEPNDSIYRNGENVNYKIIVRDVQDGSTEDGSIDPKDVKVTLTYIPEGKDLINAVGHQRVVVSEGRKIINDSDCKACHASNEKVNGPSYEEIAAKYSPLDVHYLVSKVIKGGSGTWGESLMSAHPQLSVEEVSKAVDYILSLKQMKNDDQDVLPLEGVLRFKEHLNSESNGNYVLSASYIDKGNKESEDSAIPVSEYVVFKSEKQKSKEINKQEE